MHQKISQQEPKPAPELPKRYLLVYGTLRQNAAKNYNFSRFGHQEYVGEVWMNGLQMYSLGGYPFVRNGLGQVLCEIHRVALDTLSKITRMEVSAGYDVGMREIVLPDGTKQSAAIYIMSDQLAKAYINRGVPRVESGDWNVLEAG